MNNQVKIDGFEELFIEASLLAVKLFRNKHDIYISKSRQENSDEKRLYDIAKSWASRIFDQTESNILITGSLSRRTYEANWHFDSNQTTAIVSIVGPGTEYIKNDKICSLQPFQTLVFGGKETQTPLLHRAPLYSGHRLIFQARM